MYVFVCLFPHVIAYFSLLVTTTAGIYKIHYFYSDLNIQS